MRRYNKKNVTFLLVPLLIIIFFSGNATADTYSFSADFTFGNESGHLDDLSVPEKTFMNHNDTQVLKSNNSEILEKTEETFMNHNDTQEVENLFFIKTNKSVFVITCTTDPHVCVDIKSSPKGANISIDEDLKRVTPYRTHFKNPGNHTFKVDLEGYQTYEERLFICESGTLDVILEPLPNETPTLTPEAEFVICVDIKSSPEGAEIWLDEEYNNVTPSRINFDRPGNHTFKLDLNGHITYQESFFISESRTLDVILEPLSKETPTSPTSPTPVPEPSEVFEKTQKTSGNTTKVYKEESLTKSKSKSSSAFFHPSPTPPGFLTMYILIAIFLVYFLKFKNKR
jgi:hypothetical protein